MLSALELKRKIWHMLMGLIFIFLVYIDLIEVVEVLGLLLIFVVVVIIQRRRMSRMMHSVLRHLERKENIKDNAAIGSIFFLMGALVVMVVLPKNVFLAVILILTIGDAAAPLIGQFGHIDYFHNRKKKLEGVVGGVVAGALAAMIFVPWYEAWLASLFAIGLEGLDLKIAGWKVDDNFLIPIVGGLVIGLLRVLV